MSDLKELLEGMAAQARRYEVTERALARSRTIRHRRRVAGGSGALVLVAGLIAVLMLRPGIGPRPQPVTPSPSTSPGAVAFPTHCTVERLPLPLGQDHGRIVNGDSSGRFVVGLSGLDGPFPDRSALFWDDGAPTVVDLPGEYDRLTDVTATGFAVGFSKLDGEFVPWTYHDGTVSRLPGDRVRPLAVNEQGVIVGTTHDDRSDQLTEQAVVWRSPGQAPQPLPGVPRDWDGMASDIDEDGTIVGWRQSRDFEIPTRLPMRWGPDGSPQELRFDVDIRGFRATSAWPYKIRNGWITGTGLVDAKGQDWRDRLLWTPDGQPTVSVSGRLDGADLNAQGWLVVDQGLEARLASSRQQVLLPQGPDAVATALPEVVAISDDGRLLAGDQQVVGGGKIPVRWRCG